MTLDYQLYNPLFEATRSSIYCISRKHITRLTCNVLLISGGTSMGKHCKEAKINKQTLYGDLQIIEMKKSTESSYH